ncbi:MAG: multicopper oxidase domain-containing protein, partial [Desulfobacterales bacterium]
LGPIIRVRKNQKIRIHFKNNLPDRSIIHWHGLHVPAEMDGHPRYVIPTGATYTYEFEEKETRSLPEKLISIATILSTKIWG